MKNTLKIDFDKQLIIMDRTFASKAKNTANKEYEKLQAVRKDYPNFEVTTRTIKRNSNKQTYARLSYSFMKDCIRRYENERDAERLLSEFEELRFITKCRGKGKAYPIIKKWFLERYKERLNHDEAYSNSIKESEEIRVAA